MTLYLVLIGIALCICLSAFCSAAEMSVTSCSRARLESMRDDGEKGAVTALKVSDRYDDALSAILIGNNLANIAASSLGSVAVILIAGAEKSASYAWVATLAITVLVIIFGETIPKITTKKNANSFAVKNMSIVQFMMIVLKPVILLVVGLIKLLTAPFKGERDDEDPDEAVEELQYIIETAEDEEVIDEDSSELVQAAIDFAEISASEVMTARVDVQAIDVNDDWEEIISAVEKATYSRLPVYEDSVDNVIGVLYMNRFLKAVSDNSRPDIRSLLMPPCYVYKTMKLPAVLSVLRKAKQHLAIVTDEFGGTLGVISMEDVLEQIVGEIWDDTDEVEHELVRLSEGEYELDGYMPISDFLELIGIREDDFDFESTTVGGWTLEMFGCYPQVGDSFEYDGLKIKVLEADSRRVERVLLTAEKPMIKE